MSDNSFDYQKFREDEHLEEKYFFEENFRKIRKQLILDIANARIEELNNIILNKNINLNFFKKGNIKIFLIIDDELILNNFSSSLKFFFSKNSSFDTNLISDLEAEETFKNAANISAYGWKKEAIPITHTKNSIISRIFNSIFG